MPGCSVCVCQRPGCAVPTLKVAGRWTVTRLPQVSDPSGCQTSPVNFKLFGHSTQRG